MTVVSTQSRHPVQPGTEDGQPLDEARPVYYLRAPSRRDDIEVQADALRDGGRPTNSQDLRRVLRAALADLGDEFPEVAETAEGILTRWEQREAETAPSDEEMRVQWEAQGTALAAELATLFDWATDYAPEYRALEARAAKYRVHLQERWVARLTMDWERVGVPCERKGGYVTRAAMEALDAATVQTLFVRAMALRTVTPEEKKDSSAASP